MRSSVAAVAAFGAVMLLGATASGCSSAATSALGAGRPWRLVYNGYGHASGRTAGGVTRVALQPATPTSAAQTHAALVVSERTWGDFSATIRLRTSRQLRTPHPNPWEVGWILWHYTDDQHFYYIALKPNGWELGKADPHYPGRQRFLLTAPLPAFPPRHWYTVSVTQCGDSIGVSVDGHRLARFTDHQDPYQRGRIGLYTEDAAVTFEPVDLGPATSCPPQ